MMDLIDRAEAQTALQFAARRYMVAHEAHGEGKVEWSANLIDVVDAMNALREVPSAQPEIIRCKDCKMWDQVPSSTIAPEYHRCRAYSSTQLHTTAMDFCSRAERR